jgi:hypothetical protein
MHYVTFMATLNLYTTQILEIFNGQDGTEIKAIAVEKRGFEGR